MKDTVFFVINSLGGGGAERVASRLSAEWGQRYNLIVIPLQGVTDNDYVFSGNIINICDSFVGATWFNRILNCSRRLDELAEAYHPRLVVSFLQNSNMAVLWMNYKVKKIVSVRNYLPRLHKGVKLFMWNQMIKKFYPRADYVVSVSKLLNEEMMLTYNLPREKCVYIYNPYNLSEIQTFAKCEASSEVIDFCKNNDVLVTLGNISISKGHFHLVRILYYLQKEFPKLRLIVIGSDKGCKGKIIELTENLGLTNKILFTGHQANPYCILKLCKIFVFPSLFEGFPNALLEAMICGLPVVSSDCMSGPREILAPEYKNQYGLLFDDDTTEWLDGDMPLSYSEIQCCEYIKLLLSDSNCRIRYGELSMQRSLCFDISEIVKQWYKLMD